MAKERALMCPSRVLSCPERSFSPHLRASCHRRRAACRALELHDTHRLLNSHSSFKRACVPLNCSFVVEERAWQCHLNTSLAPPSVVSSPSTPQGVSLPAPLTHCAPPTKGHEQKHTRQHHHNLRGKLTHVRSHSNARPQRNTLCEPGGALRLRLRLDRPIRANHHGHPRRRCLNRRT